MAEPDRKRNSNRRISFNEDLVAAQAAQATAIHAQQEGIGEASKADIAWHKAPKEHDDALSMASLAAVLEGMEEVPGGAGRFVTSQVYLRDKAAVSKHDFEIICGELDEWLLMTPEQQDRAVESALSSDGQLPERVKVKLSDFFSKLDVDHDQEITLEEATKHWGKNFAKINATAMFNEVDTDGDGKVTIQEWFAFWENVLTHGYTADEIEEELDELFEGGSWVDFNDGRTT